MLEAPRLDVATLLDRIREAYAIDPSSLTFIPSYDARAASYRVVCRDGHPYFLKVRFGALDDAGLVASRFLADRNIGSVMAPLPTASSSLSSSSEDHSLVLYPFVAGRSASVAGMTEDQWRSFGSTLRAIHAADVPEPIRRGLKVEGFDLPCGMAVRHLLELVDARRFESRAAFRLARFWKDNRGTIEQILARAESLGALLRSKRFESVLCHGDIHAGNVLVGDDGRIHLVDWEAPLIAPSERDLLFVLGSLIARAVQPAEELLFFDGYGPVDVDPDAIVYYRYERVCEDLAEFGRSVFLDPHVSESVRAEEAELAMGFFAPGEIIDTAETVTLRSPAIRPRA
ncbi:MAG: phosphotransferase [Chloroflexi bacterium]|nr:phosphotransferase [Chloroflexota bacterium]